MSFGREGRCWRVLHGRGTGVRVPGVKVDRVQLKSGT